MAGAAMKDISLRIRSVESTRQITSAMQLVAGSKLRRCCQRMEDTRPYLNAARQVLSDIASHDDVKSVYFEGNGSKDRCVVVIAGDRGLAGHYNAAVFKMADELIDENTYVIPVGKKACDHYGRRKCKQFISEFIKAETMLPQDCRKIAEIVTTGYINGDFGSVTVVSTTFVSAMTQEAKTEELLPIQRVKGEKNHSQMIMEPGPAALLKSIMPDYLTGCLYAYVCDAVASEMAARRNAMDSATKNADEMIHDLSLKYNRARQGSITQEITEIVAGAEQ